MADAKKILFSIEIEGSEKAVKNATQLRDVISETREKLKANAGDLSAYAPLEQQLLKLQAELKDVEAEHRKTIRSFSAAKTGQDSYYQMNQRLVDLREEFKKLSAVERNSEIGKNLTKNIAALDAELKDIDASIGQFQRNVGNYGKVADDVFAKFSGSGIDLGGLQEKFGGISDGFKSIGQAGGIAGKSVATAFAAIAVVNVIYDGITALKEYSKEFLELRTAVNKATGETGTALDQNVSKVKALSDTFGDGKEEIIQAANAISKNFKTDFASALDLIEKGFLAGGNNGGKFVDSLTDMAPKAKAAGASLEGFVVSLTEAGQAGLQEDEAIEKLTKRADEFSGSLDALIDTSSEYTQRQIDQLNASQHLAAAQNEVSKSFDGLTASTGGFLKEAGAVVLEYLAKSIEGFSALPAILQGAKAGAIAFFDNIKTRVEKLGVDFDIFILKTERLVSFGDAKKLLDDQIADLQVRSKELANSGKDVALAFDTAMREGLAERDAAVAEQNKAKAAEENQALQIAQEQVRKELDQQRQSAAKQAASEAEARRKAQESALADLEKYNLERVALLAELSKQLAQATVEGIRDAKTKEVEAENLRFAEVQAALKKQGDELVKNQKDTRKKLVEVFKEGSKEVEAFDRQAISDRAALQKSANQTEDAELFNHILALNKIDTKYNEEKNAKTLEAAKQHAENFKRMLASDQSLSEEEAKKIANNFRAQIDKALSSENLTEDQKRVIVLDLQVKANKAAFDVAKKGIVDSIQKIQNELKGIADGTLPAVEDSYYAGLIKAEEDLIQRLAELEHGRTDQVRKEAKERQAIRLEETEKALQTAGRVIDIASSFAQLQSDQELAEIQKRSDAKEASIAALEAQLKKASASEKAAIQKRIDAEKDGLAKIAAERKAAEKEAARTAKAFAIIQSIINTALAVTKALTISVGNAIAVGIAGAIQTAIIAAQPVATGGVIGDGPVIPVQMSGQRVLHQQNIPTQRNGDNVLAMLTRGEVVLNSKQQARLGGPKTFAAIGVPGFAEGGHVSGSLFPPPDVAGSNRNFEKNLEDMLTATNSAIVATNARIDRIRVVVVSEDVRADLAEGDTITAKTILE